MLHPRGEELYRLADDGDARGVLSIVTLDEIAQYWCDLTSAAMASCRENPAADDDEEPGSEWWPVSFMSHRRVPDHLHRELLVKLVQHAPDDDVLSAIGAGLFEDWLHYSPDEIHWLNAEALKDPRFQRALDNVYDD